MQARGAGLPSWLRSSSESLGGQTWPEGRTARQGKCGSSRRAGQRQPGLFGLVGANCFTLTFE
jgi:hypothetical protein